MTARTIAGTEEKFATLASDAQIERAAKALEANGITTHVVETADEAKKLVFSLLPDDAEVFTATSRTLDDTGFNAELEASSRLRAVRNTLKKMDPKTQWHEMVKLGAAPQWVVGSVHAVTEKGEVLVASASGSQLGPYSAGAQHVVWVVGAQKLVKDFDEGMQRIYEHALPLEDERAQQVYGIHSAVAKVLAFYQERPGRITMVIVKEKLGF